MDLQRTLFGYHFTTLSRLMFALCKQGVAELGLRPSHMPFMAELLHYDRPVTQDELSAALAIDKAATARALDLLEQDGFVTRVVNPDNRRQKLVAATPKAREMQEPLFAVLRRASSTVMGNLTREETDRAVGLLDRMIENAVGALK